MESKNSIDRGIGKAAVAKSVVNMLEYSRYHKIPLVRLRKENIRTLLKKSNAVNNLISRGFTPEDLFLANPAVNWVELRQNMSVQDILDWKLTFSNALDLGIEPKHFEGSGGVDVLKQMNATTDELKTVVRTIQDLEDTAWTPKDVKDLGFTFDDLIEIGVRANNMKSQLKWTIKDVVFAYDNKITGPQWFAAKFDPETAHNYGYDMQNYACFVGKILNSNAPSLHMRRVR